MPREGCIVAMRHVNTHLLQELQGLQPQLVLQEENKNKEQEECVNMLNKETDRGRENRVEIERR